MFFYDKMAVTQIKMVVMTKVASKVVKMMAKVSIYESIRKYLRQRC